MVQQWTLGSKMSWLFGNQNPNMSSKFLSGISRFHCHDSSPQGVLSLIPIMTFSSRHLLSSKAQAIWRAEDEAVNEAKAIIPRDPMVTMAQKKCYNKNIHTYHLRGWFIASISVKKNGIVKFLCRANLEKNNPGFSESMIVFSGWDMFEWGIN